MCVGRTWKGKASVHSSAHTKELYYLRTWVEYKRSARMGSLPLASLFFLPIDVLHTLLVFLAYRCLLIVSFWPFFFCEDERENEAQTQTRWGRTNTPLPANSFPSTHTLSLSIYISAHKDKGSLRYFIVPLLRPTRRFLSPFFFRIFRRGNSCILSLPFSTLFI